MLAQTKIYNTGSTAPNYCQILSGSNNQLQSNGVVALAQNLSSLTNLRILDMG